MNDSARILIAEDEPHLLKLLANILEEHGYTVELARDGLEAWSRVQRDPRIDLLLTDLRMPNLDGYELLGLLARLPEEHRPPCLVLTAVGGARDRERARALGAAGVMTKPFRALEVLEAVRAELVRTGASAAAALETPRVPRPVC